MANGEHPISGLMNTTLEKIRQMVDSNTIIGNPINTADGSTILPVSKVTFGFTSGGSDFVSSKSPKDLFGGGSGAGVSIQPVAFLVIQNGNVKMLQIADNNTSSLDRALNMLPDIVDKVSGLVAKGKKEEPAPAEEAKQAENAKKTETVVTEVEEIVFTETDE